MVDGVDSWYACKIAQFQVVKFMLPVSQCKENRDLTLRDYGRMILHTVQSCDYFLHDIMKKLRHHNSTRANDCVISIIDY